MTTQAKTSEDTGHARWAYRLRVSSGARVALEAEWGRCRWVWNECGPAALDTMLTEARRITPWLRQGSSVPQQQLIRDFGASRAKALKDIKDRLPMHRRAGMPRWKKKRDAAPPP